MYKSITKEKGDTGLIQVIADLDKFNIKTALPISEHLPFDLIAISGQGGLSRISVKYVGLRNGSITIPLRSVSTNMQGYKAKTINFNDIDAFAVYCPDNEHCYYIKKEILEKFKSGFVIRIESSKRKPTQSNLAIDFINPDIIFD